MVAIKDMEMPKNCYDCYRNMYCIVGIDGGWRPDKRVEGCPLVEVQERKVGKWEFIGDNCFRCTECGAVYTTGQFNTVSNYREKRLFPKGCPNCGAEMRGAENE